MIWAVVVELIQEDPRDVAIVEEEVRAVITRYKKS